MQMRLLFFKSKVMIFLKLFHRLKLYNLHSFELKKMSEVLSEFLSEVLDSCVHCIVLSTRHNFQAKKHRITGNCF